MNDWVPLVLSAAGAAISFFTMVCVAIIGWLAKYVFTSTDRRIVLLETKTEAHDKHIASATTQTAAEGVALAELSRIVSDMRDRIEQLASQIAVLVTRRTTRK